MVFVQWFFFMCGTMVHFPPSTIFVRGFSPLVTPARCTSSPLYDVIHHDGLLLLRHVGTMANTVVPLPPKKQSVQRVSRDDVERLSRGQPANKKGYGSRNVPHHLNQEERAQFERAMRKGYLELSGGGNRRSRKGSPLTNIHRQWSDAREKPQIILYKAFQGDFRDELVTDLSPLRLNGAYSDVEFVKRQVAELKVEALDIALSNGMEVPIHDMHAMDQQIETQEQEEDDDNLNDNHEDESEAKPLTTTFSTVDWGVLPIWRLPLIQVGPFVGERSKAKLTAKALVERWNIAEPGRDTSGGAKTRRDAGARHGGKTKMKGLSEHRRRD